MQAGGGAATSRAPVAPTEQKTVCVTVSVRGVAIFDPDKSAQPMPIIPGSNPLLRRSVAHQRQRRRGSVNWIGKQRDRRSRLDSPSRPNHPTSAPTIRGLSSDARGRLGRNGCRGRPHLPRPDGSQDATSTIDDSHTLGIHPARMANALTLARSNARGRAIPETA